MKGVSINKGLFALYPVVVISTAILAGTASNTFSEMSVESKRVDFNYSKLTASPPEGDFVKAACTIQDYFRLLKNKHAPKCPEDVEGY